jgi:hypothetical protein
MVPTGATTFRLKSEPDGQGPAQFKFVPADTGEIPDALHGCVLTAKGSQLPSLADAGIQGDFPIYTAAEEQRVLALLDGKIIPYLAKNEDLMRLATVITISSPTQDAGTTPNPIDVHLDLYQFSQGVADGRSLLVFWTSLSPSHPMNDDGIAIGYD